MTGCVGCPGQAEKITTGGYSIPSESNSEESSVRDFNVADLCLKQEFVHTTDKLQIATDNDDAILWTEYATGNLSCHKIIKRERGLPGEIITTKKVVKVIIIVMNK